jgi:sec-independent protein translocase protein TatC
MSDPQVSQSQSVGVRKRHLPRSRKAVNPEARMPLVEHIRELRDRVFRALIAMTVGAIAGWFIEPTVWTFVTKPYCRLPAHIINPLGSSHYNGKHCYLIISGLFDALFLHLKLAIIIGLIISAPFWLYQLWAFIAPGLHSRERRWAYFFGASAVPLFALGGGIAYFAMTKGLRFLLGLLPPNTINLITVNSYLGYAIAMLLIFGLAFELPLVMVLLNLARILTHQRFKKWRRMIIFGVVAFAAFATPSPDPISMLLLAVPCVILVEFAEVFAWANDRRRLRQVGAFPGLTAEEVAEYGLDTDPLASSDLDEIDR